MSFRYVKKVLDSMGLAYTDTGSAKGWLKSNLTSGGPGGKGWDLVIIAAERKSGVSGEFFDYVMDALNRGSSVILEVWYLDDVSQGTASSVLSKCGVKIYKDFLARNANEQAMYVVNPDSPILHEPNDGINYANVTSYWPYSNPPFFTLDLGDLMQTTGRGDAQILVGTVGTDRNSHGTLTVCIDGRLILETFSDHQIAFDDMRLAWENFIVAGLKARLQYLSQ